MSRRTLLLSCIVLFGLLVFALGVLSMLHIPLEPADKTPATTIWSQTYGGIREEQAYSLIQTSDGGYALAGRTSSSIVAMPDFWLVKVDSSGNLEWNKTYGGPDVDVATSVVETSDGGYALAG